MTTETKKWGHTRGVSILAPNQRTLLVDLEGIGLGIKNGEEVDDRALEVYDSETARILRDANRGRLRLLTNTVDQRARLVADLIDIPVDNLDEQQSNGYKPERIKTNDDLIAFARGSIYIEDPTGFISSTNDPSMKVALNGALLSSEPAESTSFGRVISLNYSQDGTKIILAVNGETKAGFQIGDKRNVKQVRDAINKYKQFDERRFIHIPEVSSGITSLSQEIEYLEDVRGHVMSSYEAPLGSTNEAILKILLSHCESSVTVSNADKTNLENRISPFTKKERAVPISISMAIATRIQNSLKFAEADNLPTYAWLHFGNFITTINEKIKTIHKPGIRVTVFDEASLFGPLMGIDENSIKQHLEATRRLLSAIGAPIEIVPLTSDMFPADKVDSMPGTVDEDKVYSIVCSRPDMNITEVMDPLYAEMGRKNRSYAELRKIVGDNIWTSARSQAEEIARHLEYRKRVGLFEKLVGPIAVDATVTDKDGRVVFDVTSNALFNHAIPVVRRDQNGLHKVQIVPEYRVRREFPNAKPIKINKRELGADPGEMTFYYLDK